MIASSGEINSCPENEYGSYIVDRTVVAAVEQSQDKDTSSTAFNMDVGRESGDSRLTNLHIFRTDVGHCLLCGETPTSADSSEQTEWRQCLLDRGYLFAKTRKQADTLYREACIGRYATNPRAAAISIAS